MNDQDIIDLYWQRNQDAIQTTEQQYGHYCHTIAWRILDSHEDADAKADASFDGKRV